MTASSSDSPLRRLALAVLATLPACRAGLPPDPPDADPMNANANIPTYQPPANPYETSAFAGAPAPAPGGHEGNGNMNHGAGHEHMGHGAPAATPTPDAGHDQMDHSGHVPTPAKPAPVDHSGHTGKAGAGSTQTEPRR